MWWEICIIQKLYEVGINVYDNFTTENYLEGSLCARVSLIEIITIVFIRIKNGKGILYGQNMVNILKN